MNIVKALCSKEVPGHALISSYGKVEKTIGAFTLVYKDERITGTTEEIEIFASKEEEIPFLTLVRLPGPHIATLSDNDPELYDEWVEWDMYIDVEQEDNFPKDSSLYDALLKLELISDDQYTVLCEISEI
jgi:hypothetical protein